MEEIKNTSMPPNITWIKLYYEMPLSIFILKYFKTHS